ncbi:DUF1559 domain-containing protein [Fuerstiella marisgermanici]|uniref:Putative major pilin subunit n=1 Tax=Fuerstiella marisgermanici TaxID=1891926 RepID=A0A1P8WM05_9PLAN|nr:DUF1559 domain-containing protein [Fuerstiella marisgermanici]APZ95080.1 putative major pilin subunit [Fuerstiella marisgermanici]
MQSRRFTAASPKKRRGFTLIELLVVISIIATLMSLILPAIQNAREAGRRTQCLNNLRNVTVAALNFASSNKSRLPALGYFPTVSTGSGPARIMGRSWALEMLPYMDQQGTYDRWNKDAAFDAAPNLQLASTLYIEAFACPNDESAYVTPGGLSYVANAGFGDGVVITNNLAVPEHSFSAESMDWDGDGVVCDYLAGTYDPDDAKITQATGVFWPEFEVSGADTTGQQPQIVTATRNGSATVGKIYDGSGNTLMFGENLNAGGTNWADPRTRACGFMVPVDAATVNGTAAATSLQNIHNMIGIDASTSQRYPAFPNEAKTGPEGQRPYLNSNHPGIVVVSMCDGSARTISENIDESVYIKLITPNGTRLRNGIAVESPLSADQF